MNLFDHKDLGNHLLKLWNKVVKHPVYIYIPYKINLFLINLQERITTVTTEAAGNAGEEDSIKIKTEEDCAQLAATIKAEEEVSVLCWCFMMLIYL
jgi:hypothetical protein